MKTAIQIENVSKTYRLYDSTTDRVKEALHLFGRQYFRPFQAVSDLSLDIGRGETFGIIGRNGSGKSTLLQIVCGILEPTSGAVKTEGNVSALLDLGAGFHREFTGRQNVFMNASILGMSHQETEARLHQIESFAEIGSFIDQPVKTYSKGMYIRLAFSIAVSLDPDILVIDEILAVGDERFRRKCYDRIREFQSNGVTVLVVSHSANMIVDLCDRAALLDRGELIATGDPKTVISNYQKLVFAPKQKCHAVREQLKRQNDRELTKKQKVQKTSPTGAKTPKGEAGCVVEMYNPGLVPEQTIRYRSNGAVIVNPFITNRDNTPVNMLIRGNTYTLQYEIRFLEDAYRVRYGAKLKTVSGFELGDLMSHPLGDGIEKMASGATLQAALPFRCVLLPGTYFVNNGVVGMKDNKEIYLYRLIDALMFKVQPENKLRIGGIVDFSIKE